MQNLYSVKHQGQQGSEIGLDSLNIVWLMLCELHVKWRRAPAQGNVSLSGDFRHMQKPEIGGSWRQALPTGVFVSPTSPCFSILTKKFEVNTIELRCSSMFWG